MKIHEFRNFTLSEEAEKPADLSQKIVFKMKKKEKSDESSKQDVGEKSTEKHKSEKSKRKKEKPVKVLLSFEDVNDDSEDS